MSTLLAEWGIWRPYDYPNGFRRPRVNQPVEIVARRVECRSLIVRLASGEQVETDSGAVVEAEASHA